jgi:flagellar hook protein FlgE
MSAFNIGLSGLSASSKDLDVTSNNIANAETVGFKRSRTEFADVFATTAFGATNTQSGSGVTVQAVSQQFNQGNLQFSENSLDLAVSGQGFFVLKPNLTNEDVLYSRAGAFQVDKDGFVTNAAGQFLQGFPVNPEDGSVTSSALASVVPIRVDQTAGSPKETNTITLSANLDSSVNLATNSPANGGTILPTDSTTYNFSTSVNIYDSQGNTHTVTYYYALNDQAENIWDVSVWINNGALAAGGTGTTDDTNGDGTDDVSELALMQLDFDGAGLLEPEGGTSVTTNPFNVTGLDLGNGTDPFDLKLKFDNTTQFATAFAVTDLNQDGLTVGRLNGLDIDDNGVIRANFSNGQAEAIAKVALANFDNPQGLRQLGDTNWAESIESGEPVAGEAGTGVFGLVKSGALEQSNVDLTAELVHLIVAQRNFQANAKSIETASRITDAIINIR